MGHTKKIFKLSSICCIIRIYIFSITIQLHLVYVAINENDIYLRIEMIKNMPSLIIVIVLIRYIVYFQIRKSTLLRKMFFQLHIAFIW
jgi:hypothetical protein